MMIICCCVICQRHLRFANVSQIDDFIVLSMRQQSSQKQMYKTELFLITFNIFEVRYGHKVSKVVHRCISLMSFFLSNDCSTKRLYFTQNVHL